MQGSFKWVAGETVMWKKEAGQLKWEVHPPREVMRGERSLLESRVDWEVKEAEDEAKSHQREPQWWKPEME
jgi:hypothetical protein